MTARQIIYVPGKNPKPEAALHREILWRILVEGVRRADSAVADTPCLEAELRKYLFPTLTGTTTFRKADLQRGIEGRR